jgi:hypothetical protein
MPWKAITPSPGASISQPVLGKLCLDQALGVLLQAFLDLAHAERQ